MAKRHKNQKHGGYSYFPSDEMIASFSKLSCEEKLQWLADATSFLHAAASTRTKKTWQRLRRGEKL